MGLFGRDNSDSTESTSLLDGPIQAKDVETAVDRIRHRPADENVETSEQLKSIAERKPSVVAKELPTVVNLILDSFRQERKGIGTNQALVWHRILDAVAKALSAYVGREGNDERLLQALYCFIRHSNKDLAIKASKLLDNIESPNIDGIQRNPIVSIAQSQNKESFSEVYSFLETFKSVGPTNSDFFSTHIDTVIRLAVSQNEEVASEARSVLEEFGIADISQDDKRATICISLVKSGDEEVVVAGLSAIETLDVSDVQTLVKHVNTIINIVESDKPRAADQAASVLETLTNSAPQEFLNQVDDIERIIESVHERDADQAVSVLETLTNSAPQEFLNQVDDTGELLRLIQSHNEPAAVRIASNLSREYPESVLSATEILIGATDSDDQEVQAQAVRALVSIASEEANAVSPYLDTLVRLLEHDSAIIRKNACEVFGYAGEQEYIDAIRKLRAAEESDVRVTAETALQRIEQGSATPTETQTAENLGVGNPQSRTDPRNPDKIGLLDDFADDATVFETIDFVGSGGNGRVEKCRSPDGRILALKQPLFEGETLSSEVIDKFIKEAATWAKLDDHENIVSVYDVGRQPIPWIAMEYVGGGNLNKHVGSVDFETATDIATGITSSVRHAHRRGVAHLDLKPENVLITETTEEGSLVPKVTDWGLAKMLIDHTQSVDGYTPQYAAPEQFDPETYGTPDDYTDIYQVGTLVYELFTGQPPFEGAPAKVMHAIVNEDPTPPSEVDPSLPTQLDEILLRALKKEKDMRYETLVNFRNDLVGIQQ